MNEPVGRDGTAEASRVEMPASEYRRALGTYPTGVAVITAREESGEPVGMVVGTFTSISLEPRLVGFLPDRRSSSWPRIRKSGRFCVNVLNAGQEDVCRAFASKAPDRWERHVNAETVSGPRLDGVTLFVECEILDVIPAGDHDLVLGSVQDMEVLETADMPLLFMRGGYGAPSVPFLQAETPGLVDQLRMADLVRPEIEALADEIGLECRVTARDGRRLVILAAAGIGAGSRSEATTVGTSLPLIAPLAPLFVVAAPAAERERWLRAGQEVFGDVITPIADRLLERAASGLEEIANRELVGDLERLLDDDQVRGLDNADLRDLVRQFSESSFTDGAGISSMAVPVLGSGGKVDLVLQLVGFSEKESAEELAAIRSRLKLAATRAADRLR